MPLLYDTGIRAYHLAVRLAAPFHEKAALLCKGRKATRLRLRDFQRGKERLVWFHAASLGEFEQGRPVMEKLREMEPDTKILLTFFLPQAMKSEKTIPVPIIYTIFRPTPGRMPGASSPLSGPMPPYSSNTNSGIIFSMNCTNGKFPPTSYRQSSGRDNHFSKDGEVCTGKCWVSSTACMYRTKHQSGC